MAVSCKEPRVALDRKPARFSLTKCWILPGDHAPAKSLSRSFIIYLTAPTITENIMTRNPEGLAVPQAQNHFDVQRFRDSSNERWICWDSKRFICNGSDIPIRDPRKCDVRSGISSLIHASDSCDCGCVPWPFGTADHRTEAKSGKLASGNTKTFV